MINNKQYIIAQHALKEEEFQSCTLYGGRVLSYHQNLPVQLHFNEKGLADICILGYAFQAAPDRDDPMTEAAWITREEEIAGVVESWSGTWTLLWKNILWMDAGGVMGCFYSGEGDHLILSRSIHLINTMLGRRDKKTRLTHRFGLDYYPGPNTVYKDIRRLMPCCHINYVTGRISHHRLLPVGWHFQTDEQRNAALIAHFDVLLRNVEAAFPGQLYLALTGGYDSRTLMALLEHAGVHYQAFTMEHGLISASDIENPPKLADAFHVPYTYIRRVGTPSQDRYRAFDTHCAWMSADEDRNFYAYHQYPEPGQEHPAAILRAGIWEVSSNHIQYAEKCGTDISKYEKQLVNVRGRRDIRASLKQWLEDTRRLGPDGLEMEFVNRFYWEQRIGCWLSGVEQALTILDGVDCLQTANCARIQAILLDYDRQTRIGKGHELELIHAACPQMPDLPLTDSQPGRRKKGRKEKIKEDWQYIRKCFRCLDPDSALAESWPRVKKIVRTVMKKR